MQTELLKFGRVLCKQRFVTTKMYLQPVRLAGSVPIAVERTVILTEIISRGVL
jgi:hypothetical protein